MGRTAFYWKQFQYFIPNIIYALVFSGSLILHTFKNPAYPQTTAPVVMVADSCAALQQLFPIPTLLNCYVEDSGWSHLSTWVPSHSDIRVKKHVVVLTTAVHAEDTPGFYTTPSSTRQQSSWHAHHCPFHALAWCRPLYSSSVALALLTMLPRERSEHDPTQWASLVFLSVCCVPFAIMVARTDLYRTLYSRPALPFPWSPLKSEGWRKSFQ